MSAPPVPPVTVLAQQLADAAEWVRDDILVDVGGDRPGTFPEWPWHTLREALGPLVYGTVTYLAAFPGSGKTTLLSHLVRSLLEQGHQTAVFPLEASYREFLARLMCVEYGMDADDVLSKRMRLRALGGDAVAAQELQLFTSAFYQRARDIKAEHPWRHLAVDPLTHLTPEAFWSRCAHHAARGVRVIIVDHVDHVQPEAGEPDIAASMRIQHYALRAAQEFGMVVLLASQLNVRRLGGDRLALYRPPQIDWLWSKGPKDQIARLIIGLYRPVDPHVEPETLRAAERGEVEPWEIAWKGRMGVRVMKGRYEGANTQRSLTLAFDGRTLTDVTLPGVMAEKIAGQITPETAGRRHA